MRKMIAAALALSILASGCSSAMRRASTYGPGWQDANFEADGMTFKAWVHPTDKTIMLQVSNWRAAAQGFMKGASFGLAHPVQSYDRWMAGATALTDPAGCLAENLRALDQEIIWEFTYVCPKDVDLRALIKAQRDALQRGVALHK